MRQLLVDIEGAIKDILRRYRRLLAIPATTGDEGELGDRIAGDVRIQAAQSPDLRWSISRVQDSVIITKGAPQVVLLGRLDTLGFMAGYDRTLLPIGAPKPKGGERLFGRAGGGEVEVPIRPMAPGAPAGGGPGAEPWRYDGPFLSPGTRLAYRHKPFARAGHLHGPALDGRLSLAILLTLLEVAPNLALCLMADGGPGGAGLNLVAPILVRELGLTQALRCAALPVEGGLILGRGPALSLLGPPLPRQRYLDRLMTLVSRSSLPHQLALTPRRSAPPLSVPLDVATIGYPLASAGTQEEAIALSDVRGLFRLYLAILGALDEDAAAQEGAEKL